MAFTRTHLIVASLILACGGLAIYAASMLGDYLRERREAPSDIERTLGGDLLLEDGSSFDRSLLSGKVVVVASWATWCPSCRQMLFDLSRAKERFGSDLEVVAINRAEEQRIIDDYRSAFSMPEDIIYVNDANDTFFAEIDGRSMSEMVFYTREGIVSQRRTDAPTFDALMTTIDGMISQ